MSYARTSRAKKRPKLRIEERPTFYHYMFRFFRWMDWRYATAWLNRKQYPTHNVFVNGRHTGVRTVNDHARKVKLVAKEVG
jgi:hypothetical protein